MKFVSTAVTLLIIATSVRSYKILGPSNLCRLYAPGLGVRGVSASVSNLVIVKNVNMGYNNLGLQQDLVEGPVYAAGIATAAQVPVSVSVGLDSTVSLEPVNVGEEAQSQAVAASVS